MRHLATDCTPLQSLTLVIEIQIPVARTPLSSIESRANFEMAEYRLMCLGVCRVGPKASCIEFAAVSKLLGVRAKCCTSGRRKFNPPRSVA